MRRAGCRVRGRKQGTSSLLVLSIAQFAWSAPARSESPDPGDLRVIEILAEHGSDLSRPHPIDFYLYFAGEAAARQACSSLASKGFETRRVSQLDSKTPWLCLVQKALVPTAEALTEARSTLEATASRLDGEYDGWETPILGPE